MSIDRSWPVGSDPVFTSNIGTTTTTTVPAAAVVPDDALWLFHGVRASRFAGERVEVTLDIDVSVYPTDGVWWAVSGVPDRHDILGPLDGPGEVWHPTPRPLAVGDWLTAVWSDRDGVDRLALVVVGDAS